MKKILLLLSVFLSYSVMAQIPDPSAECVQQLVAAKDDAKKLSLRNRELEELVKRQSAKITSLEATVASKDESIKIKIVEVEKWRQEAFDRQDNVLAQLNEFFRTKNGMKLKFDSAESAVIYFQQQQKSFTDKAWPSFYASHKK